MDFFMRNLEAAQQQARSLTLQASQSAKGLAEQLSEHTKTIAEQAATASSAAAEQAGQRWKGLNLQESLQLRALQQPQPARAGPSKSELEQYAITPEFLEFIRSLTYSTFRDFPLEKLPEPSELTDGKALTPWQEQHALLVVQEVKEIDELRFVLCPKRMTDGQFWQVYFTLARKYLPAEAFDGSYRPPDAAEPRPRGPDLSGSLKRTFESARETALEWSSRASGSLRPAETSAQLHDLVESRSRGNTPTAAGAAAQPGRRPFDAAGAGDGGGPAAAEDMDTELEAYLRTISDGTTGDVAAGDGASAAPPPSGSEEAEDLDKYLSELATGEGEGSGDGGSGSGEEAVDLEDYMQELQAGEGGPH